MEVYKGYALKHANCFQGGMSVFGGMSPQHYVGHWVIFENKPGGKRIDSALTRDAARRMVDRLIYEDENTIKPWIPGGGRQDYGADLALAFPKTIANHIG